jgi:phosphate transport system substrate-binding protein
VKPSIMQGRERVPAPSRLAVLLAGAALLLAGCTKPDSGGTSGAGGTSGGKSSVRLTGSDTMLQLAQSWSEEFSKAHPDITINVNGGGSGTGMKALVNGTCDVANSSRPIEDKEREAIVKAGHEPKEFIVAQDALSIVVHPSNPVNELTVAQIKDIYKGTVTNWKQLGGPDLKITINSRETSSGTYKFFQEHVLNKEPFADEAQLQPSTNAIVQNVAKDRGAIGYVGLGYVNETIKVVKVKKDASSPAVAATVEEVLAKNYPLARPLYMYTAGDPTPGAKTFIDFVQGEQGQKIVKDLDFVPVK